MKIANGAGEGGSRRQAARPLLGLPEGLCCPSCRRALDGDGSNARCCSCGRTVVIHGGRIPDFLAPENPVVDTVLSWPDDFVQHAERWLLAVALGKPVDAEASAELAAQQLLGRGYPIRGKQVRAKYWRLDQDSRLTSLGSNLAYHCAEFSLQSARDGAGAFLEKFRRLSGLGAEAKVLDVGCGAGQTLRLLQPYQPAERIGFDIDLEALAFGCRLAESNGEAIRFVRASAYHIPFRDNRFSHVICRVGLNYLHQWRAVCEMARVLQPQGYLYCSAEGPGFDLHFLKQAHSAAQVVCRLRDLLYGLTLAWAGVQLTPGSRLTGGRVFGTVPRCAKLLSRAGCNVVHAEITSRYLGLPMAFDLVARKQQARPHLLFSAP